jgi:anti-sigma regulatory factor (Ser/Thr protein kinase)
MKVMADLRALSEIQRFLLVEVQERPREVAKRAVERFRVSRQAVNRHLRRLVELEFLEAEGETKSRRYHLRTLAETSVVLRITPELQEDRVWLQHVAPLLSSVSENVVDICHYGFTEIVNNAIDHSGSPDVGIGATLTAARVDLGVWDRGIGIFRKIREGCGLEDERHAVLELTKGKLTTDPAHHTGEGIFFTSRMFDEFGIKSGRLYLGHHAESADWLLENREGPESGTSVVMSISPFSTRASREVFERYATPQDDYAFSRTHVVVELARSEGEKLVSRSQAKRVLARLDRFKEVVLDYAGVASIGPAFADEIYRVFANGHPAIRLVSINMTGDVESMVRRAERARG